MPLDPKDIADFEKVAQAALTSAQFCFPLKPISVNAAYQPIRNGTHADIMLTHAAKSYKDSIYRSALNQKKLYDWETHPRYFSMWVIVDEKYNRYQNGDVRGGIDIDNCHKLIQDAFCSAGIVPNDKYAKDTRQMYADFSKNSRIPKNAKFAVFIRWGNLIHPRDL